MIRIERHRGGKLLRWIRCRAAFRHMDLEGGAVNSEGGGVVTVDLQGGMHRHGCTSAVIFDWTA